MSNEARQYPRLSSLIAKNWREKQQGRSIRKAVESKVDGYSPAASTFYAWLKGQRKPDERGIKWLIVFFAGSTAAKQDELRSQIDHAIGDDNAMAADDPYHSIVLEADGKARVGVVSYFEFSGPEQKSLPLALNAFVNRFMSFANMNSNESHVELEQVESQLCDSGQLHLALGFLATPNRFRHMRFFQFPISMPVNAVVVGNRQAKTALRLLKDLDRASGEYRLIPITHEKEVGGQYVANYVREQLPKLRLKPVNVSYAAEEYLAALIDIHQRAKKHEVPVCVADERMCLEIVRQNARRDADRIPGLRMVEGAKADRVLPQYWLSFAMHRKHEEWIRYIIEAMTLFLDSNAGYVVELFNELRKAVNRDTEYDGESPEEVRIRRRRIKGWFGLRLAHGDTFLRPDSPWALCHRRLWKQANPGKEGSKAVPRSAKTAAQLAAGHSAARPMRIIEEQAGETGQAGPRLNQGTP